MLDSYTDDQLAAMTPSETAHRINEEAPEGVTFRLTEDVTHWDECGIVNGLELVTYLHLQEYTDIFKELEGFKPRWIWEGDWRKHFCRSEARGMVERIIREAEDRYHRRMEEREAEERRRKQAMRADPLTHNPFAVLKGAV